MKNLITLLLLIITANSTAQITTTKTIKGVWQSEGYGRIIEIKEEKTRIYDICKINCTESEVFVNNKLLEEFDFFKISDSTLILQDGISKYHFEKLKDLPELCSNEIVNSKDPWYNFDVLWQTFKENYCYFEVRNIDWDALKTKYESQITSNTKPFELLLILDRIILELNDGHSIMFVPNELKKDYKRYLKKKQKVRLKKLKDSLGKNYKRIGINVDEARLKIVKDYVSDAKTFNQGGLNYGLINENIALVQINGMSAFGNNTKENVARIADIMKKVMLKISPTKACIIDIRFNGGGYDEVQLEILKHFATKEKLVFTKKARDGNGYTQKTHVKVTPTKHAYKGEVYILTSHQTSSAAEDFTLAAMAAIPNAVRIGSNTHGIFSDLLIKKLPNGWNYSLSNEVYESTDGKSYEAIGIAPHYKIEYDKRQYWFYRNLYDNRTGKDSAIEKAIELINSK